VVELLEQHGTKMVDKIKLNQQIKVIFIDIFGENNQNKLHSF